MSYIKGALGYYGLGVEEGPDEGSGEAQYQPPSNGVNPCGAGYTWDGSGCTPTSDRIAGATDMAAYIKNLLGGSKSNLVISPTGVVTYKPPTASAGLSLSSPVVLIGGAALLLVLLSRR